MPLWFKSCQRRNEEKMASVLSITPSALPPFSIWSYTARARKPLRACPAGGTGCAVKFPKSSVPLSIMPFPFRSNTRNASSVTLDVQETCSELPSPLRSKFTPFAKSVKEKPSPLTSIKIGLSLTHLQVALSQAPLSTLKHLTSCAFVG